MIKLQDNLLNRQTKSKCSGESNVITQTYKNKSHTEPYLNTKSEKHLSLNCPESFKPKPSIEEATLYKN